MELEVLKRRHSLSHILAQAIQREIDINVKLWVWPAIDNWFYYDVIPNNQITEEQLSKIEDQMKKITKENQTFSVFEVDIDQAKQIVNKLWQSYKIQLIEDLQKEWVNKISFYINGINSEAKDKVLKWINPEYINKYEELTTYLTSIFSISWTFLTFIDMCEWPHVENTKEIDSSSFKLSKIAWAYWRWDEKNDMMTRIYGYAFENKDKLKEYLNFLEEAQKRDHRILWDKMKIFTISKLVWAWLPLLQPNWMLIRKEIEDYLWELHKNKWYLRVWTPHLAKEDLYKTSWHADKFWDELFRVKWWDDNFFLKPMNCPHHMQIFADNQFSYRDMPIRYFEPATVYRDEKTWQLSWLTRVRAITQDDWHLFCRIGQISDEVWTIVSIIKDFYTTMWMIDWYWVRLSIRWPEWKYLWSDEVWEKAEWALKLAAEKYELPYKIWVWEAAFYGPKLDFMFKDAIWREWQLATIQCDFNLPERFDLSFINENWEKERPVVIHRAISWSLERFMWVMIEHFAWVFPLWLCPEQVRVIPVSENFMAYADKVCNVLKQNNIRAKLDIDNNSLAKKIRNAELMKVYYIIVVWEKESTTWTVAIREYKSKKQYEMNLDEFISKCNDQIKNRVIE